MKKRMILINTKFDTGQLKSKLANFGIKKMGIEKFKKDMKKIPKHYLSLLEIKELNPETGKTMELFFSIPSKVHSLLYNGIYMVFDENTLVMKYYDRISGSETNHTVPLNISKNFSINEKENKNLPGKTRDMGVNSNNSGKKNREKIEKNSYQEKSMQIETKKHAFTQKSKLALKILENSNKCKDIFSFLPDELKQGNFIFGKNDIPGMIAEAIKNQNLHIENKKLRKQLEINKSFIGMFSHDIGLPLTSIKANVELMHEDNFGKTSDEQKKKLRNIMDNVERINSIKKESLMINKIESGSYSVNRRLISIYQRLMKSIQDNRHQSQKKNQDISLENGHFSARTDPEKLRHIMDNLLSNAVKYSLPGKKIVVSAEKMENFFRISVKDQGVEIPDDMKEKIFDRFTRAHKEMATGTGLGLSIVKMLVEAQNGKIWYEPNPEGGSIFTFELPR